MTHSISESARPRRVLLGVTGGIAAYKAPELVRRLRERGAEVRVVLSRSAAAFVTPLSLQAVSGHRVRDSLLDAEAEAGMGHIELARWADDLLIAPATADVLARLALGRADDLLTTLALATGARLWLAPAMNHVMWNHPAVQANWQTLVRRGAHALGPEIGDQACGEHGPGRMMAPEAIAEAVLAEAVLAERSSVLAGKRFVVTAGPTFEPLDPVRYIGNRSSGRMGFAVAEALRDAGAEVALVAGPVHLATPAGIERIDVRTAIEMHDAVFAALPADGFVGVAAVADYRPERASSDKIKRDDEEMSLRLVPNPDIVRAVAASRPRPFTVGFAAETGQLAEHARVKLEGKGLDLIAANRVGEALGFDRDDNALVVHARDGEWNLGHHAKTELARRLVALVAERMQGQRADAAMTNKEALE
jgi:phosphopantothenoylcysteine decarboxylase/phosphopantothenate--cysteine ligase